jgi:hypothetical protein
LSCAVMLPPGTSAFYARIASRTAVTGMP